ncbi:MAG TPA: histidine kinase [Micromonosporaceae bacterium]
MSQSMVLAGQDRTDEGLIAKVRRGYFDLVVDDWGPRRWIRARIATLVFLGFLVGLVNSTAHSDRPMAYRIGLVALIVAYAALFLTVIWRNTPRLHANRAPWAIVASLVVSVPLLMEFGQQWLSIMTYLSMAMLLFNARNSRWPFIVLGIPAAEILIGRYALGDTGTKPFAVALQALLIGAIQAAFYQQVQAKLEMRRMRADMARLAVSEERLRISRDLHDILGQQLSAVSLKAELAARLTTRDPERAATEMTEVAAVARAALADVRETVTGFRTMSLCGETETARALLAASGVETNVDICQLPKPLDVCGAWLIREAVTNVIRHAGATHCQIKAERTLTSAVVEVRDDGGTAGIVLTYGTGLTGLAERVESEGGELVAARDGRWFVVRATFGEAAVRSAANRAAAALTGGDA